MDMLMAFGTVFLTCLALSGSIALVKYIYKQYKEFGSISRNNKENKNFLSLFLEKRKLETEISVIKKRKELDNLKAEEK